MEFLIGFVLGGILNFLIGVSITTLIIYKKMTKMLSSGEMYIKQNGKWHPHNPFRSQEKDKQ